MGGHFSARAHLCVVRCANRVWSSELVKCTELNRERGVKPVYNFETRSVLVLPIVCMGLTKGAELCEAGAAVNMPQK